MRRSANVRIASRSAMIATAVASAIVLAACGSSSTAAVSASSSSPATTSAAASVMSSPTSAMSSAAMSSAATTGAAVSGPAPSSSAMASAAPSSADTAAFNLLTPGTLTVGMNLQFKPEMYLDDAGKPAGYDVDLLTALTASVGLKLDIQNLDFDGLIPGLQSKKFDLVSVGLTATDARKQVVDFSRAYVPYTSVLAVKNDDTTSPTVASYNVSGKVITALQGSSGEQLAKKTFPNATVTGFSDQSAALLQVATGRAAGSVLEDYILAQYQKSNPNQVKKAELPVPLELGYGSWAVQKGNTALTTALDKFLCGQQTGGGLAKIYQKNFGVSDFPAMPTGC